MQLKLRLYLQRLQAHRYVQMIVVVFGIASEGIKKLGYH